MIEGQEYEKGEKKPKDDRLRLLSFFLDFVRYWIVYNKMQESSRCKPRRYASSLSHDFAIPNAFPRFCICAFPQMSRCAAAAAQFLVAKSIKWPFLVSCLMLVRCFLSVKFGVRSE